MLVDRAPLALRFDIDMDGFGCDTTSTRKRNRDDDEDVVDEEARRVDKARRPLAYSNLIPLTPFPEIEKRQRDCFVALCPPPPPAFQIAFTTISVPPLLRLLSSSPSGRQSRRP